jgi:hypothetical protein
MSGQDRRKVVRGGKEERKEESRLAKSLARDLGEQPQGAVIAGILLLHSLLPLLLQLYRTHCM